jgi:hypothetical protein
MRFISLPIISEGFFRFRVEKLNAFAGYRPTPENADRCKLTVHFRPAGMGPAGNPQRLYNNFPVRTASCRLLTLNFGL